MICFYEKEGAISFGNPSDKMTVEFGSPSLKKKGVLFGNPSNEKGIVWEAW